KHRSPRIARVLPVFKTVPASYVFIPSTLGDVNVFFDFFSILFSFNGRAPAERPPSIEPHGNKGARGYKYVTRDSPKSGDTGSRMDQCKGPPLSEQGIEIWLFNSTTS